MAYGTFFLHLYTKANAPCVLCHGCKSLYPPGQYIHHACPALPPNIVPCRSRMWRRCLVPLMSPDMDKTNQKERWKFVLEKFSHASTGIGRRNLVHPQTETPHVLEMPECKRGKFVREPSDKGSSSNQQMKNPQSSTETLKEEDTCKSNMNRTSTGHSPVNSLHILNDSIIVSSLDMDGWMDRRTNGGWINGWMDGWMAEWLDEWMAEWLDGWIDGWLNRWMDG